MIPILPLVVAILITSLIIPVVIAVYRHFKILDDPSKNHHPKVVHTRPLPRGAGIAIMLAVLICVLIFVPIDKHILGILIGGLFLMLVGIWDDVANPPPLYRLLAQFGAALVPIASGIGIAYVTNPLGGIIQLNQPQLAFTLFGSLHTIWIVSDILALIWIVWCMNIINFSKGLDGQMPGYVAIAAFCLALLSLRFSSDPSQLPVTILSLIVCGAYIGFLFFNFYPQKIMSGFGASTLAGFFLSILAILSGGKLATAILVLALPMIDALLVILTRLREGKSPFMGDRGHLHHKLMDMGWGKRRIAVFYWICAAILGVVALQLNSEQKLFTIVLVGTVSIGFILWLRFFSTQLKNSAPDNG